MRDMAFKVFYEGDIHSLGEVKGPLQVKNRLLCDASINLNDPRQRNIVLMFIKSLHLLVLTLGDSKRRWISLGKKGISGPHDPLAVEAFK